MRFVRILVSALAGSTALASVAQADENGISFWLPGQYGSFAASPVTPGWSWTSVYYHTSVAAGAGQQFPRGGRVDVGLDGQAGLVLFGPSYTFETPLLGGAQLTLAMIGAGGRDQASVDAVLTGPLGRTISGELSDSISAFGDLYPTKAALSETKAR